MKPFGKLFPVALLSALAVLPATWASADVLNDGAVISLRCEGSVPGPRWLDGNTVTGGVGLVDSTGGQYTGTSWRVIATGNDTYAFENLGHIDNPDHKFLDCLTQTGGTQLAPSYGGSYTGTIWEVRQVGAGRYTLMCLGHIPGNRYLDGNTMTGSVGLAPQAGGQYSGAIWSVH